jgi:hypothetical protein
MGLFFFLLPGIYAPPPPYRILFGFSLDRENDVLYFCY